VVQWRFAWSDSGLSSENFWALGRNRDPVNAAFLFVVDKGLAQEAGAQKPE
jgi:hypothetical protein